MAWRSFKKDLDKTYQKIDKIAKKGKDNFQEYYNYIDNLIINKQYGVLTQVLFIKYDFDYTKYFSVTDVKEQSWKNILFRTKSFSQDGIGNLLKKFLVYRIGLSVFTESDPTIELGKIKEIDVYDKPIDNFAYTNSTFQEDSKNKLMQLVVEKIGTTQSATFSTWNADLTYDRNVLSLYNEALSYLID